MEVTTIIKEALRLNIKDRAKIADSILASLDSPDEKIDEKWKIEVESRVLAYENGNLASISLEDVLAKYSPE